MCTSCACGNWKRKGWGSQVLVLWHERRSNLISVLWGYYNSTLRGYTIFLEDLMQKLPQEVLNIFPTLSELFRPLFFLKAKPDLTSCIIFAQGVWFTTVTMMAVALLRPLDWLACQAAGAEKSAPEVKRPWCYQPKSPGFLSSYSSGSSLWTKTEDKPLTCNQRGLTLPCKLTNAMLRVRELEFVWASSWYCKDWGRKVN